MSKCEKRSANKILSKGAQEKGEQETHEKSGWERSGRNTLFFITLHHVEGDTGCKGGPYLHGETEDRQSKGDAGKESKGMGSRCKGSAGKGVELSS